MVSLLLATFVKKIIDQPRGCGIYSRDFLEIGQGRAGNRLGGAESMEQGPLARRADPLDFVERAFGELLFAARPMGSDRETMRLVAQPLHEIKRRIAREQLERLQPGHKETLPPGVAVRALGDRRDRHAGDAKLRQNTLRGVELSLAAVDKDKVWPIWERGRGIAPGTITPSAACLRPRHGGVFLHKPREAPPQDFPHHSIIIPWRRVAVMDVKRAIMHFHE